MLEKVHETVQFLEKKDFKNPDIGIILGTGLGALVNEIEVIGELPYEEIPHFPQSTVEFHKGKLIYGKIGSKRVIAMQGRFHYYEGYNMHEVVFPVRVMKYLGIKQLLVSNAAGNMNLEWSKGQLMLIDDHINLQPDNPLRGREAAEFGQIFVDMSAPYDPDMNQKLSTIAKEKKLTLQKGVYVAVAGPNLETKAEYRWLRNMGADVVGMSTVPEVIAANQLGLPVSAISVLTDDCDPENLAPINIDEIIQTAATAEKDLVTLFVQLIQQL
ncbi:MAG: purine-nucleoside phosphorylase [Cyclobacteriaceae bacterium]